MCVWGGGEGGSWLGWGGITSHRRVLLYRGWLITVGAPGRPGHSTSTQLGVVVKYNKIEKKKKKPAQNTRNVIIVSPLQLRGNFLPSE